MQRLRDRDVRLALGLVAVSLAAGVAYLAATYVSSVRATYPQKPLLAAAVPFLERGADPRVVLPGGDVEVGSGRSWMTVTDADGAILASNAVDDSMSVSLASCHDDGAPSYDCFFVPDGDLPRYLTVEVAGTRQAVVATRWASAGRSGYAFAGRDRSGVDERGALTLHLISATWLAGLGAFWFANRTSAPGKGN
jgi:hypothetical protein